MTAPLFSCTPSHPCPSTRSRLSVHFAFALPFHHNDRRFSNLNRSHVHVVTKITIFNISMFDFAMRFHIISSCEFLTAHRTFMALWPMYVGMMPSIRYSLVATNAPIQCWKCSRQLNKQWWVVNVVISTCYSWTILPIFHHSMTNI